MGRWSEYRGTQDIDAEAFGPGARNAAGGRAEAARLGAARERASARAEDTEGQDVWSRMSGAGDCAITASAQRTSVLPWSPKQRR